MKKITIYIVMAMLCLFLKVNAQVKMIAIKGRITNEKGLPISNVTIKVKGSKTITIANGEGLFELNSVQLGVTLIISSIGFKPIEINNIQTDKFLNVQMLTEDNGLEEVQVVSTGYQNIPKERATGAFVFIDSALLNRKVGTNILDRLDGVTSGLIFNKITNGSYNNSAISIRGRSTIFANANPLIVVDNFPYEGDINNINPNDIDNITILKDAAAASIWGARSGNGVIVITTKKGKTGEKVKVSVNVNTTLSERPDIKYKTQMSSSEFIDLEQYLFQKGFYNNNINNGYSVISPAVAVMLKKRTGQISIEDSLASITKLKYLDVRDDIKKYVYRPELKQQYSLNLSGGTKTNTYYISAGYDKNNDNLKANNYERFTMNANNSYFLINDKLQVTTGIMLNSSKNNSGTPYTFPYVPYEQLIDASGKHLSVLKALRKQYTDTAGKGKLLDWEYRPLDENFSNRSNKLTDYKLNANVNYKIIDGLTLTLNYQYQKGLSDGNVLNKANSYFTRNLINSFTQLNQNTLVATRPIPIGDIKQVFSNSYTSNYGRIQLNYDKKIGYNHDLHFLSGFEAKDYQGSSYSNTNYGYNSSTGSSIPVDYLTNFRQYYGGGTSQIPTGVDNGYSIDRFRSYFVNGSYTYHGKYTISASARRDESNIFGVKANQKGVPLWSIGLLWNISDEGFYNFELIQSLKFRSSFGYSGNVDRTTTAYLTSQVTSVNVWNAGAFRIVNPPNPSLRWEKIRNLNLAIDFTAKGNIFSGSFEYFVKDGIDLIGNSPIAPQTGVAQFRGNSANTRTSGLDVILNKNVTSSSAITWQSTFLFSHNRELITDYKVNALNNGSLVNENFTNPKKGYPYYAIFSFPYQGLDNTGKPQGLLNGKISQDYAAIQNSTNESDIVYNGSAIPTIYGSFRNTFSFKKLDISFNLIYKFNYFFRRPNVFAGGTYGYSSIDYDKRWQVPGDELKTNIPALYYPSVGVQNSFVQGADFLVEKADHIRIQDIRFSYHFRNNRQKKLFKEIQAFTYINNIGILWKATKEHIDPDFSSAEFANPKSIAVGFNLNF